MRLKKHILSITRGACDEEALWYTRTMVLGIGEDVRISSSAPFRGTCPFAMGNVEHGGWM
jgi:hypothetical protein